MQDLEYTPSVCFLDHTSAKHNLSAELFFELTCTPNKQATLPVDSVFPQLIHQSPRPIPASSTLKTEDFFEDFQNNFVVTFEDDKLPNEDLARTATFQLGVESQCLQGSEREGTEERKEGGRLSLGGASLVVAKPIEEKGSPVSFEVRKRTVFKAKENISNQAQNFKLTKKKIFNHNIFQQIIDKVKISPFSLTHHSQNSIPHESQLRPHPNLSDFSQPVRHKSILERHGRDQLRSASLNHWRKRFNREKQAMEGRRKQDNIFQVFSMR